MKSDYFTIWNIAINQWADKVPLDSIPILKIFAPSVKKGILSDRILPEPYYCALDSKGKPLRPDVVVINMNPGNSSDNDVLKEYPSVRNRYPWLYYKLLKIGNYKTWQSYTSPLNVLSSSLIPGVDWWKEKRLDWLGSFTEILPYSINGTYKIFAAELCPLHSKKWTSSVLTSILRNDESRGIYLQNILYPILERIIDSKLGYGIAFGASMRDLLLNKKIGFQPVCRYDSSVFPTIWPRKSGKLINRTYDLLRGTVSGKNVYVLCLYAPGGFSAPSIKFSTVEEEIKKDILTIKAKESEIPSVLQPVSQSVTVFPSRKPRKVTAKTSKKTATSLSSPTPVISHKRSCTFEEIAVLVEIVAKRLGATTAKQLQDINAFPKTIISPTGESEINIVMEKSEPSIKHTTRPVYIGPQKHEVKVCVSSDTWIDHHEALRKHVNNPDNKFSSLEKKLVDHICDIAENVLAHRVKQWQTQGKSDSEIEKRLKNNKTKFPRLKKMASLLP